MAKFTSSIPNGLIALDAGSPTPLYRQLYDSLRRAILAGQLAPGIRLQSTREMAAELNVSRNTVVNAYEQLLAEGYLEGQVGSGTYVSRALPEDLANVKTLARRRTRPGGGLFLWVELPAGARAEELFERAIRERVAFVPGAPFFVRGGRHNFMRLNFSNSTPASIEEGVRRLGSLLRSTAGVTRGAEGR